VSGWHEAVVDDPDEDVPALVSEALVRDDGVVLGGIVRFENCGPTYAWSQRGRIGPCSPVMPYVPGGPVVEPSGPACDAAARAAVERALEKSD
jgi:hypothetical protein